MKVGFMGQQRFENIPSESQIR